MTSTFNGMFTFSAVILPVVQKQHQFLLCNVATMEALPLYLDKMFNQYVAVILAVIPQAMCTRYGLAVGANFVWLLRVLMVICYPIAYPIGKILDCVLGHHEVLFRQTAEEAIESTFSLDICQFKAGLYSYVAGGNPHETTHHLMAKGEKTESVVVDIKKATAWQ
ncbi:hypothetical protein R3W88_000858 [Solanum pinnatisectum]|uniref:CNNM transmembrane domain-containing protein n=1 Tax=Solanum pinnatisectum TaxID=50273 RepID=A0AAV9MH79_9SOLN|nr:hypothetical protein R3W88_000858 [Solanum pinnatisectum]